MLRKASIDTMKDRALLAKATEANSGINPDGGEELEQNVKDIFRLDQKLIANLKYILR